MRYVFVSDRWLKGEQRYCALCCDPIQATYVRDYHTRLIYCQPECADSHVAISELSMEDAARHVA
jgi:hypothetical protein